MNSFECEVDKTKLRSSGGQMKTEGLFWEKACKINNLPNRKTPTPVFTLKDYPHKDLPSLYEIYIDSATEYEAALRALGSWKHWKKLTRCQFFKPYLDEWREERSLREEAMAKTALLESLLDGNVSAAKTILDEKKRKVAGRPSNDEVTGELKRVVEDHNQLSSIVERMQSV